MIVESAEQLPLYLHYISARKFLAEKLGATPQEIAMWVWLGDDVEPVAGTKSSGLRAYRNAAQCTHVPVPGDRDTDDLDDAGVAVRDRAIPERFHFSDWLVATSTDYQLELLGAYFLRSDLEAFDPEERYIGYDDLRTRWAKHLPEAEAVALIRELAKSDADLPTYHPITGGALSERIVGVSEEDLRGLLLPAIDTCIFSMNDVESVEANVFTLLPVEPAVMATPNVDSEIAQPVLALADAREAQRDVGDRFDPTAEFIRKQKENLAHGRGLGVAKRKETAAERDPHIRKAASDYFQNNPRGSGITNDEVAYFMAKTFPQFKYKHGTWVKKVKPITTPLRAIARAKLRNPSTGLVIPEVGRTRPTIPAISTS